MPWVRPSTGSRRDCTTPDEGCYRVGVEVSADRCRQFFLCAGFVLDDVTCNGASRDRQRTCQIHLSRPAAAREISVLRADHDLLWSRGHSRPGVNACAAARLDHVRTRFLEYLEISLANAV